MRAVLVSADHGRGARADLAIGVPRDIVTGHTVGAVNVLYGAAGGPTAANDQRWHLDVPGVAGIAQEADRFGSALR